MDNYQMDNYPADQEAGSCPLKTDRRGGVSDHQTPLPKAVHPPHERELCPPPEPNPQPPRKPHRWQ